MAVFTDAFFGDVKITGVVSIAVDSTHDYACAVQHAYAVKDRRGKQVHEGSPLLTNRAARRAKAAVERKRKD